MDAMGCSVESQHKVMHALNHTDVTAGGGGDGVAIEGVSLNLANIGEMPDSVNFAIDCKAVLAETKTLTISAKAQVSANGSDWTDVAAATTVLTLTGGTGGSTEYGVGLVSAKLRKKDIAYVRVHATPDLSATSTDTARVSGVAILGGLKKMPPSYA